MLLLTCVVVTKRVQTTNGKVSIYIVSVTKKNQYLVIIIGTFNKRQVHDIMGRSQKWSEFQIFTLNS